MLTFLNPLAWFRAIGQFISNWLLTVPWRDIPSALPALVLLVALSIAVAVAYQGSTGWRNNLVDKQVRTALELEDFQTAELVTKRQLLQRPDDTDLAFRLASLKHAQESTDEASRLMRELVRIKSHTPAAKWLLANEFIGENWTELDQSQRNEFGSILQLLTKEEPANMSYKQLYADYLIASERYATAIPLLNDLASVQPMRGLQAAALARKAGNNSVAERYAKQALETVGKLSEEDPTNSVLALAIAQNQLFLRRYAESRETLIRGIKRAKTAEDRQKLSIALGDAIVAWVAFLEESPQQSDEDRLRILALLQEALAYAPNNPRVLTLVADQVLATMNQTDKETRALRKALVQGTSPGIAHFIRGTAALMVDDFERAEKSLLLAEKELPRSGAILNNLAVALSMGEEPKLDLALKMSEKAIELTPAATPHFYETRGQILTRLGRHIDAIPDLEKALRVKSLKKNAHRSLAICYDGIGDKEVAQEHRQLAERLK